MAEHDGQAVGRQAEQRPDQVGQDALGVVPQRKQRPLSRVRCGIQRYRWIDSVDPHANPYKRAFHAVALIMGLEVAPRKRR